MRMFKKEVTTFVDSLDSGDSAIFYFAGHGVEAPDSQGGCHTNWLLAKEVPRSNDELQFYAIDAQYLLKKMQGRKTRFNLLILDCCRNNPLPATSRSLNGGLGAMTAPAGSMIAFACAPGQQAAEHDDHQNSIYTKHLLQHLETRGLEIHKLFIRVANAVSNETSERQEPWTHDNLKVEDACLC